MAVTSIVVTVNSTVQTPASIVVGIQGAPGPRGSDGATGATGAAGADGAAGAAGATGPAGADGSRIHYGTAAPADDLGADGDFYFDSATGDVWTHGGSAGWNFSVNLTGPQGAQGAAGATGATGSQGPAGADGSPGADGADGTQVYGGTGVPSDSLGADGDWYIDSASGLLYQHGGSAGWNVSLSLIGPQGPAGADGAAGATGAQGPAGADATAEYVVAHEAKTDPHPQYKGIGVLQDGVSVATAAEALEFVGDDFTLSVNSDGSVNLGLENVVKPNRTKNLTKGYTATAYDAGTKSSGTFTPDPANGALQKAVNGGAHTLAPPSTGDGDAVSMVIQYTNNGSAGAVTTSGFTKVSGSFTTTNGDDFMCYITRIGSFSHLNIQALQ